MPQKLGKTRAGIKLTPSIHALQFSGKGCTVFAMAHRTLTLEELATYLHVTAEDVDRLLRGRQG